MNNEEVKLENLNKLSKIDEILGEAFTKTYQVINSDIDSHSDKHLPTEFVENFNNIKADLFELTEMTKANIKNSINS